MRAPIAGLALVVGLLVGFVAAGGAAAAPIHDTDVVLHPVLVRGAEATAWVRVTGATTLDQSQPVAGAEVVLSLTAPVPLVVPVAQPSKSARAARGAAAPAPAPAPPRILAELVRATTAADGVARVRFRVPELAPGAYSLVVATRSPHGQETVRHVVEIAHPVVLHLRTDRPVYRAGQTIRWRTTVLGGADAHPRIGDTVAIEVRDPRRTSIWRGEVTTDAAGMASGEIPLGDDLIFGRYELTARAGAASATESVSVRDFVLPPFAVEIEVDGTTPVEPGATITGHVVARYPYGEPVAGTVRFGDAAADAPLDAGGKHRFSLRAPTEGTSLALTAKVTDGAGRVRETTLDVPIRADALELAVVPDRSTLVAGASHRFTILTTDGAGSFVPAKLHVRFSGRAGRTQQASDGAAQVALTLRADERTLRVEVGAIAADGRVARRELELEVTAAGRAIGVRDPVVTAGRAIAVEGNWPAPTGALVAVLLRRGAPVAAAPVVRDAQGRVTATLIAPEGVFGLASVRVVEAGWSRTTGVPETELAQATVYLVPAKLAVTVDGATRHRPGEDARVGVTVRDAAGKPAAGVGLAASVVDERVLALGARRPDLVTVLGSLDTANAEAAGLTFAALLARPEPRARLALAALLTSLPAEAPEPIVHVQAAARFRGEYARIGRARDAADPVLLREPALGVRVIGGWEFRPTLDEVLVQAKLTPDERRTPWEPASTWTYARRLDPTWTFDALAPGIASARLDELEDRLRRGGVTARRLLARMGGEGLALLVARKRVEPWMTIDPWGGTVRVDVVRVLNVETIELTLAGPDQRFGTKDDVTREDVFGALGGLGYGLSGYGSGGGGMGFGRASASPNMRSGSSSSRPGPLEAHVRARFDETVLWATGLRTDAAGRATLSVPLADSITGWEVAVEAVAQGGAVGSARARLETFLPVHLDAEPPPRLTVGDALDVPLVIANHGATARTFTIGVRTTGAIAHDATGTAPIRVAVPAGEVRSARVPVRARATGEGTLEVTLSEGKSALDALRRTIAVEAPGTLVRSVRTADDPRTIAFTVPKEIAPGTATGRLRVFRGVVDQALDGLEDLVREPHGCFEQTSSATYPNLLVLDVLRGHPGAEALRTRARTLVGKGYQRLISYEVGGGGFSWFGESPANQVLTAYGLLEFVDMAKVYPVDPELVVRTRAWLISKQQADGSWRPDASWLHDWSNVQGRVSTTAFVAWALAESGSRGKALDRALGYLRAHAADVGKSPYLLALWAAAETAAGHDARTPLARLARFERKEGDGSRAAFGAGGETLFYGKGRAADVQVTALAAMALGRTGDRARAGRALGWLWSARDAGGWGSTQGTVLALRAAALGTPAAPLTGTATVKLDGRPIATIDLGAMGIPTVDLPAGLAAGEHKITIDGLPAASLTSELRLAWREAGAPVPVARGIEVTMSTPDARIVVGGVVPITVTIKNPVAAPVAMPMVIVPVPPGFRIASASLAALTQKKLVSRAEDQGSEVRLYLDRLAPYRTVALPLVWESTTAASVTQRPAQAYAYYDPDTRGASAALKLTSARP